MIAGVYQIAITQNMPKTLTFADRSGLELIDENLEVDDDHDTDYDPKYISHEHATRVIYQKLNKVLYGTLQAAMLFWEELSLFLMNNLGLRVDHYDRCVGNKTIKGKQYRRFTSQSNFSRITGMCWG